MASQSWCYLWEWAQHEVKENMHRHWPTYTSMRKYGASHVLHHADVQTITTTHAVYYIHHDNSLDARVLTVASFCQYV